MISEADIISRVNELKPNEYSASLGKFVRELELRIRKDIFDEKEPVYDAAALILDEPESEIYILYLFAVIDFLNCEFGKYECSLAEYKNAYSRLEARLVENRSPRERKFKIW